MPNKDKQINIQAKGKDAEKITRAHIALEVKNKATYNRKEFLLVLCSEFLDNQKETKCL